MTSSGWRSRCTGICSPRTSSGWQHATSIPLAQGEREWHRFTVREFIDSGAIRYVQFDCTRYAGFSEALRIAHYAEMKGVMVAPHTAAHIHAHLVSALGDAAFAAESVGNEGMHPIHHRIFHGGAHYRDGRVHLTEAPGFGIEVDWREVEALRAAAMSLDVIATGLLFPEGPIACADGSILLVEIERRTVTRVRPGGGTEIVAELGGGPNGAALGPDGALYIANNGGFLFQKVSGFNRTRPGVPEGYSGGWIERLDLATGARQTAL